MGLWDVTDLFSRVSVAFYCSSRVSLLLMILPTFCYPAHQGDISSLGLRNAEGHSMHVYLVCNWRSLVCVLSSFWLFCCSWLWHLPITRVLIRKIRLGFYWLTCLLTVRFHRWERWCRRWNWTQMRLVGRSAVCQSISTQKKTISIQCRHGIHFSSANFNWISSVEILFRRNGSIIMGINPKVVLVVLLWSFVFKTLLLNDSLAPNLFTNI